MHGANPTLPQNERAAAHAPPPGPGLAPRLARQLVLFYTIPTIAVCLAAIVLAIGIHGAAGDGSSLRMFFHLLIRDWPAALAGAAAVLIASLHVAWRPLNPSRAIALLAERPLAAAALVTVGLAVLSLVVYDQRPVTADEFTALFQAKVFASGRLTGLMPADLLPRLFTPGYLGSFFTASFETGQVVSNYWPGHALLLTPFVSMNAPWLLNPLLSGLTLLLLHRLAREMLPDRAGAGWVLLLTIASPVFIASGISHYSMPAHLLLNTAYVLLLIRNTPARLFAAGAVGSLALVLHNPFPHTVFAIPWIVWLLTRGDRLRNVGALILGYLPLTLLLGGGWLLLRLRLSESAMVAPIVGVEDWGGGTPLGNLMVLLRHIFTLPGGDTLLVRGAEIVKLFVWAVPGLPLLALFGWRHARDPRLRLIAASAAVTFGVFFVISFTQGAGWGYRYFHPVWMALPLLATAFLLSRGGLDARIWRAVAGAAAVTSLFLVTPVHLIGMHRFVRGQLRNLPEPPPAGRAVILLDPDAAYHAGDMVQNAPFLDNRVIIVLQTADLASERDWLRRRFPGARFSHSAGAGEVWTLP